MRLPSDIAVNIANNKIKVQKRKKTDTRANTGWCQR